MFGKKPQGQSGNGRRGLEALRIAALWLTTFLLLGFAVAVPLPVVWRHQQSFSATPRIESIVNLKRIGLALRVYANDHEGYLPPMQNTSVLRRAIVAWEGDAAVFKRDEYWQTPRLQVPYAVNASLSSQPIADYEHSDKIVAVWDTRMYRGGRRCAYFFSDRTRYINAADWPRVRADSGIVQDTPAPAEPPRWVMHSERNDASLILTATLFGAATSAFSAAWRGAWHQAGRRSRLRDNFSPLFVAHFFGIGFFVALTATVAGNLLHPSLFALLNTFTQ